MKRKALTLIVALAGLAVVAERPARAARPAPLPYVVVDAAELRQPVPEPEGAVTQKYDGKVVQFTGQLQRFTQDRGTKQWSFEMVYSFNAETRVPGRKDPVVTSREVVVVPVTFAADQAALRRQMQSLITARKALPFVTVRGKGSVMTDGTLYITEAVLADTTLVTPPAGGLDR